MRKTLCTIVAALLALAPMASAQPGMSQSSEKKITVTSDIRYRDGQSQSWLLDLAESEQVPGGGLRPAIVIVHGGGWAFGSKSDQVYRDLLISYALQGYVTISVEYRFVQEAPMPACIEDVKCAVRWLKAHADKYQVDPERIGVYGHSAGAHLSLMIGVSSDNKDLEGDGPWKEYSSRVACVAAGSPPTEIGNPSSPWSEHPEWWPIGYFGKTTSPMLLLQGIDDAVVKVNLTDDFVNKMTAAGADIEYVRIHGHHGVAFDLNLNVTRPAMDNFFERYLKGTM